MYHGTLWAHRQATPHSCGTRHKLHPQGLDVENLQANQNEFARSEMQGLCTNKRETPSHRPFPGVKLGNFAQGKKEWQREFNAPPRVLT